MTAKCQITIDMRSDNWTILQLADIGLPLPRIAKLELTLGNVLLNFLPAQGRRLSWLKFEA